MSKYLYGAAVQGIQNFIFQTNQLSDIVGASELVENICTTLFRELVHEFGDEYDKNSIVHAAGNIKHIFTDEKKCQDIVRDFPRKVVEYAPGITISQAASTFLYDVLWRMNKALGKNEEEFYRAAAGSRRCRTDI